MYTVLCKDLAIKKSACDSLEFPKRVLIDLCYRMTRRLLLLVHEKSGHWSERQKMITTLHLFPKKKLTLECLDGRRGQFSDISVKLNNRDGLVRMTSLLEHSFASPKECIFLLINWCGLNDDCNDLNKLGQKSLNFEFQTKFSLSKIGLIIPFYLFFLFRILDISRATCISNFWNVCFLNLGQHNSTKLKSNKKF